MAKKRKKQKNVVPIKSAFREETSSNPAVHPNATLAPGDALHSTADNSWLSTDSTNAPILGEEDQNENTYVESYAGLLDKHILSKGESVLFFIAIAVIGYVFIQDNGAGALKDWSGLFWTLKKVGVIFACFVGAQILQKIYKSCVSKWKAK
ncbi:MAG: hypothetical protein ABIE74_10445 [Pseudomonadota bacterium]